MTIVRRLPQLSAWIVLSASLLVLLGWALDLPALQSLSFGDVTIKVNTALGLALSAVAILLAHDRSRGGKWGNLCSLLLALMVTAIGAGTVAEYLFHADIGIDQLIFPASRDVLLTTTPGRMALVTASAFILLGMALLALDVETRRHFRPAQPLLLGTMALALTALLGYLYGVIPTAGLGQGIQIAIPTALAFIFLTVGALALRPDQGWINIVLSPYAGGLMARRLLPFALVMPLALGALRAFSSWTGQFSTATLSAMVAVLTMLTFGILIGWIAKALNRADILRQAAERDRMELAIEQQAASARADAESHARAAAEAARAVAEQALREKKSLEEQLLQSQKMEAVGQLASGVAHDFNNLLTVIQSYSSLLLESPLGKSSYSDDVQEIMNAVGRASDLTRQLLAFSRKQVMQLQPVDLNDIVRNVERMLRRLIGEDIDLAASLDPTITKVNADPGQMEQVLVNLAVNARDAMPDGGRLMIETSNVELSEEDEQRHIGAAAGSYVMVAVTDTGVGMPREMVNRVFEPFFTTKERGKGTGLGLSTVYGIVKQSGGDIWVYSEPGHGTMFKIYLPCVHEAAHSHEPVQIAAAPIGGAETILLVEDDPALRTLGERVLKGYGYSVLVAQTGAEALSIVTEHDGPIDLIATDVVMPGMSGRVVVEQLSHSRPAVRVLFMSGYTDDEIVRRRAIGHQAAYLQKPFTPAQFARKVREALDKPVPSEDGALKPSGVASHVS